MPSECLDFYIDVLADLFGHPINEEDAVEVIDFMLDTTSQETVARHGVGRAAHILKTDPNLVGADDITVDARK